MFKPRRVFFCANQISLIIAINFANQQISNTETIIFFDPVRCDVSAFDSLCLQPYSIINFISLIFKSIFNPPIEVCIPHRKANRFVNIYSKYMRNISLVDDGLDTFRESPKNIVLSEFKWPSNFYTFDYEISVASWVDNFNTIKVCSLEECAKSNRKKIDLNNFDYILVESPGIESAIMPDLKSSKALLVKHSNPKKNVKFYENFPSVFGANFALEASINSFHGTLIVGESMVLVYALQLKSPNFKLLVAIKDDNKKNLPSLLKMVNRNSHAKLMATKK